MDLNTVLNPTALVKGKWHFVGDSHVNLFRHASNRGWIERPCLFTPVGGATAVGLRNPNSMTNALDKFKSALLPAELDHIPVIQLGEVDCGFVIWYRAQKYAEDVEAQKRESVAAYFEFVDALIKGGYRSVVITAATLPTIREGVDWGEVANARREVKSTLRQRTDLTLDYNRELYKGAQLRRLPFIDITDNVLDQDTGVIAESFRHPDPTDHHLHPEKVGPLWAAELNRLQLI